MFSLSRYQWKEDSACVHAFFFKKRRQYLHTLDKWELLFFWTTTKLGSYFVPSPALGPRRYANT